MAIYNVGLNGIVIPRKVEESLNSSRDRESGQNFYQQQENENLPKERDKLVQLLKEEIKKLQDTESIQDMGFKYQIMEKKDDIYIIIKDKLGNDIRQVSPLEFLRISRTWKGSKGALVNFVS